MPDGKGGERLYDCKADYELIIGSQSRDRFMEEIGFITDAKNDKYAQWRAQRGLAHAEKFQSAIVSIEHVGREPVFDTTQPDKNNLIFNGLVTGNCGEQPLPPYGSCLLGSVNLTRFVKQPFTEFAEFDWNEYREVVRVFTRMLDNVVEVNGLPLDKQRDEILRKRRHGMGFLGLGSTITLLGMKYGSPESVKFTEDVSREMAVAGWEAGLELAREKGPAPIMNEEFTVTKELLRKRPEMARWPEAGREDAGRLLHAKYSRYMQRKWRRLPATRPRSRGNRRALHTSQLDRLTGTISLSLANNARTASSPRLRTIHYFRNVIVLGRKTKEKVDVFSFELLAYREFVNKKAFPSDRSG